MNKKQLVYDVLAGKETSRIPSGALAVHFCSAINGISIREYTLNPKKLAESVIRYYDLFKPDAVWISADTWVTAEAMGAKVKFPDGNQPMGSTGEILVENEADIDKIPMDNMTERGRIPVMLEALKLVKEKIGNEVFIVGCFDQSPWSLACALTGIENAMVKLIEDKAFIQALIEKCIPWCCAYGKALADAGADMLSSGDSPAGLIGPDLYRKVALPAEQKVFRELRSTNKFLSLHICGDTTHIISDMVTCGADVLEIDSILDMEYACQAAGNRVALWGNLEPYAALESDNVRGVQNEINHIKMVLKKTKQSKFVLSSGCTLTMGTRHENLAELCKGINL